MKTVDREEQVYFAAILIGCVSFGWWQHSFAAGVFAFCLTIVLMAVR
jgi:hypothetical protein